MDGSGTVVRNDKFPERAGREILKGLAAGDAEAQTWRGLIYVEKAGRVQGRRHHTLASPGPYEDHRSRWAL